ncbi:MAG TPA: NADH-quinone oxidoreductase subunit L, partial [Terriglobia bacterium]|nr:NADH-quinone oxidoreductase subunit L [Terriglobia bacterium]
MTLKVTLLIVALSPLLGAAVSGLFGRRLPKKAVSVLSCGLVGVSFLAAVICFVKLVHYPPNEVSALNFNYFTWIQSGGFLASFGFMFDQLTAVMVLVVAGIGFIIHIYSTGYMAHEGGYYRFFSYLNLFMFSMLTLVLANNFVLM